MTRVNRHKLEHDKFLLNARKHFCAVQVMEGWHRLPKGCGVSSLEISQKQCGCGPGDVVPRMLLQVSLLEQGLGQRSLQTSSILWKCDSVTLRQFPDLLFYVYILKAEHLSFPKYPKLVFFMLCELKLKFSPICIFKYPLYHCTEKLWNTVESWDAVKLKNVD